MAAEDPVETRPTRSGTIALVGRPNVGKSTLMNAFLGDRIAITSQHPQTTRDRIAGIMRREGAELVFLDTPGIHDARHRLGQRMNEVAKGAAGECDVAIFVTDVERTAKPVVQTGDAEVLAAIPEKTPTVLVVNKIDNVHPRERLFPILEAYGKIRDFAAVVPVSALKTNGTERVIAEVAKLLPEGAPIYGEDEISDRPMRFFVSEFVREQILRKTHQEVPHGVAVTVESYDEGDKIIRIAVTIHVAKESHKGILIGDGGKMLTAIGTAARKSAETLIGNKVHLAVWVRATPGWFDDPARLAELGYGGEPGAKRRKTKKKKK